WKATLQDFGPALSATVARDRVIGGFFGLIAFSIVEHLLWHARAQDLLRRRFAEIMHMLAELARPRTSTSTQAVTADNVHWWRPRISQKIHYVQVSIESSKFEAGLI